MSRLVENSQIVSAFVPVDMQTAANTGDWVSMKGYHRLAVILFKGIGTASDDPTITIQQATDVAGTSAKALNFTRVWTKQGTQTTTGTFTAVTQSAANTYTNLTSAEAEAIWVIEFDADDLDVEGGFDCVQASVADVGGNPQLGCCLYILYDPRYPQATPQSAIVD